MGDHDRLVLGLVEKPLLLHQRDDLLSRAEAVETVERGNRLLQRVRLRHAVKEFGIAGEYDVRFRIEDVDHRQGVALADLEVIEIVRRRDLHRAGADLRVCVFVGDDLEFPSDQRKDGVPADQVLVALVIRMNGDAGVAEHGFRPGRGNNDEPVGFALDGVLEMPKMRGGFDILDLEVRDRRLQVWIPVDQALVLVDQPLAVKVDEYLGDRLGQPLVHGEALAAPVAGASEPLQLAEDDSTGFRLPGPHLLDELLAADRPAARLLPLHHLTLDNHLRGDAGVIHAGLPQHIPTAHSLEPHEDVLQGIVQGMANVQGAGDIGRRNDDRKGLGFGLCPCSGLEGARLLPSVADLRLDSRCVKGFFEHLRFREYRRCPCKSDGSG